VLGGPIFAALFTRMRARGWRIDIPQQFAASLLLMALAFFILTVGIKLAGADGKSAFIWLFLNYVLQSIGELLLMPVGYAMIGKLAPKQYQGIMMGSWMLVTGLASLFAGDFSGMIPNPTGTTAVATNPEAVRRAWRRQPRGRYCARRADSVPAQADHRQGRDASHRSGYRRSRRLNRGNGFSEIEGKAARVAARGGGSRASFNGANRMSDIKHASRSGIDSTHGRLFVCHYIAENSLL
jgi:hypothetical protein